MYQKPSEFEARALAAVAEAFDAVNEVLTEWTLSGRRLSIAKTHLETAHMFINKAIVKGDRDD